MMAVLWRTNPLNCGICADFGWLVTEVNCSIPVAVEMPILNLSSGYKKSEAPSLKVAAMLHVFSY